MISARSAARRVSARAIPAALQSAADLSLGDQLVVDQQLADRLADALVLDRARRDENPQHRLAVGATKRTGRRPAARSPPSRFHDLAVAQLDRKAASATAFPARRPAHRVPSARLKTIGRVSRSWRMSATGTSILTRPRSRRNSTVPCDGRNRDKSGELLSAHQHHERGLVTGEFGPGGSSNTALRPLEVAEHRGSPSGLSSGV